MVQADQNAAAKIEKLEKTQKKAASAKVTTIKAE